MKKTILFFNFMCIISMNIYAQCDFSEEAKQHWRRANAIMDDLETSDSYKNAIDEFYELIILAPECPDVYHNLFVLYSDWAEIAYNLIYANYYIHQRLNYSELFLKVCIAMNPENKEELKNQLAKLEIEREGARSNRKCEDFLDWAYDNLKTGNNKFAERFYQLHKFITKDNRRDKFEKYFLMAYSAYSYYMEDEEEKAKAIYEEMLKIDSEDAYVRKMYDACVYRLMSPSEKKAILQTIFDNMVYVKGGKYEKQSVKSFYISRYELTQKQWRAVMGNNPSKFWECDDCPVENVSRIDINDFQTKLIKLTGKKYRLPTSIEWKYAWSGGEKSKRYKYSGSNNVDAVAWYGGNSEGKTHPVGLKQCNELGIYDMSGNVSEASVDSDGYKYCWGASFKSYRVDKAGCYYTDFDGNYVGGAGVFIKGKTFLRYYEDHTSHGSITIVYEGQEDIGFRLVLDAEK